MRDLVRSYVALRDESSLISGPAANLLLCYGVECGLKAAILRRQNVQVVPDELRIHNLRTLAKLLRIDGTVVGALTRCRRKHDERTRVEHHELHQAWRYGVVLHVEDETCVLEALNSLSDWCRKELTR